MKRLLLMLALVPLMLCAKENPVTFLQGERKLNLEINYSEGSLCSMEEDAFIPFMESEAEEPWSQISGEWKGKFTYACSDVLKGHTLLVGAFPKAKYKAVVNVDLLEKKGRFVATVQFVEQETGSVVGTMHLDVKGGVFGTITNLIGDGHEHAGEAFGRYLANYVM